MEKNNWERLNNVMKIAKKYEDLNFKEFIRTTLVESGYDEKIMDNVYIDEDVDYPESFGCYKSQNTMIAYFVNERGEKFVKTFDDPSKFMLMFVMNAPSAKKDYTEKPHLL